MLLKVPSFLATGLAKFREMAVYAYLRFQVRWTARRVPPPVVFRRTALYTVR